MRNITVAYSTTAEEFLYDTLNNSVVMYTAKTSIQVHGNYRQQLQITVTTILWIKGKGLMVSKFNNKTSGDLFLDSTE